MKKALNVLSMILLIGMLSCGSSDNQQVEIVVDKASYKPGENDALIVLKAYADKDLKTLKSYATGSQKMALDNEYFETNSNAKSFREKINHWNGSFNEIRYYEEEKNFQKHYYMIAVFYESSSGQLTGVALKSTDKENWKLSGFGTKYIKKEEFNEKSLEIPE